MLLRQLSGEVIASGIDNCIVHIPLHEIHLSSNIVSESVVVGVRKVLPMKRVSLLGNVLAGRKVVAFPVVIYDL
jgi:hypothetical protein